MRKFIFLVFVLFLASLSNLHASQNQCPFLGESYTSRVHEHESGIKIFVFPNGVINECKFTNPFNVCHCPDSFEKIKQCECRTCYSSSRKMPYPLEHSWRKEVAYQAGSGGRLTYTLGNITLVFTSPWQGEFTLSYVSGLPFSISSEKQKAKSSKKQRYNADTIVDSSTSESLYSESQQSGMDRMIRFIEYMTQKAVNQYVFYACPRQNIENNLVNIDDYEFVVYTVDWLLHMHQYEPAKLKKYIKEFEKTEK